MPRTGSRARSTAPTGSRWKTARVFILATAGVGIGLVAARRHRTTMRNRWQSETHSDVKHPAEDYGENFPVFRSTSTGPAQDGRLHATIGPRVRRRTTATRPKMKEFA